MSSAATPTFAPRGVAAPGRKLGWGLGLMAAAGFNALVMWIISVFAGAAAGERGSVVGIWSVLGVVALIALYPLARRTSGARAATVLMIGALGLLPPLFFAALYTFNQPIIAGRWTCGTGDIGMVIVGLPATAGIVGLATGVGLWATRVARPRLRAALGGGSVAVFAISSVVVISSAVRLELPQADDWPGEFASVTTLSFSTPEDLDAWHDVHRIGPALALDRQCSADTWSAGDGHCLVRLRPITADADLSTLRVCDELDECGRAHEIWVAPESPLVVRRDATSGIWTVTAEEGPVLAFDEHLAPAWVYPSTIAESIASPTAWVIAGALGLLLALLAFARRGRLAFAARELRRGREGHVQGGSVVFDDGALPARGVTAQPVETGPAVAHPMEPPSHASYRDDGTKSAWRVTAGTRAEQLAMLQVRATACDTFALAILLCTLVPLVVAR